MIASDTNKYCPAFISSISPYIWRYASQSRPPGRLPLAWRSWWKRRAASNTHSSTPASPNAASRPADLLTFHMIVVGLGLLCLPSINNPPSSQAYALLWHQSGAVASMSEVPTPPRLAASAPFARYQSSTIRRTTPLLDHL